MNSLMNNSISRYLCVSPALKAIPWLSQFLGAEVDFVRPQLARFYRGEAQAVIAWGRKPSAKKAESVAEKLNLPIVRLEDGFLRSVLLGAHCPPYSMALDDEGIYYDAAQPSRIESLIKANLTAAESERARAIMTRWREARVSKYNHVRERKLELPADYVLIVDQTFGDASITFGQASSDSFLQMLKDAAVRFPDAPLVIKTHPDVVAGLKQGHYSSLEECASSVKQRVKLIGDDVHPPVLLEHAQAVFCVTSQMGFEALMWNKPVYCYGMPFYAGWGLTTDALPAPSRRGGASLEQLVHAALVSYPRYIHPETLVGCEVEALLDWVALQREQRQRFASKLFMRKAPRWKRPIIQDFLQGSDVLFVGKHSPAPLSSPSQKQQEVVWGAAEDRKDPLIRLEDGFIRSVGLGADLIRPSSWVADDLGMYYDATRPSRLEQILIDTDFDKRMLERASQLRERLVALKVTKYNVGAVDWQKPHHERVILVPGQVESDASIRLGSPVIKHNMALLQAVREANPDAYVIYKPHPDVQAGLRTRGQNEQAALQWCDEQVFDVDMAVLLEHVDEVHTLTSLTGFEALLRGLKVVCYGQPFYAGWGLTKDVYPCARRGRLRTIEELVAAALLLYPTYVSRVSGAFCSAETALQEMVSWRAQAANLPFPMQAKRWVSRKIRIVKRF